MATVFQAKKKVEKLLRSIPGINGIGITWDDEGHPCVRVNVDFQIEETSRQKIPYSVEGIPVLIAEVGKIQFE
jgi:hypothetical protein